MSIAKFCIKHKVTTLMAFIMVSIFGVVFTTQLQMALLPDVEAPAAVVMCYYNGASPQDMEELVTRPLESAIMSVAGVEEVSSTSSEGVSQLQITYADGTDLDIAATKLREQFDLASARAVAALPVLAEYCMPLIKMKGYFIAMKGPGAEQELEAAGNALDILGSGEPEVLPLTLPGGEERSLVICQKLRFTPKGYPRHGGTILKHPL